MKIARTQHTPHTSLPMEMRTQDVGNRCLEEKWLLGLNAPKIDRIYSNDSNIETAEDSAHESNDPINHKLPPAGEFGRPQAFLSSSLTASFPQAVPEMRHYESELAYSCLSSVSKSVPGERQGLCAGVQEYEAGEDDSIILEEERESNQSLQFEAQSLSLHVNSILKPTKQRLQRSFLLPSHTPIASQTRNHTLNEDNRNPFNKPDSKEGIEGKDGLSESRVRKNACLKKKGTLTFKDSSQASFAEEMKSSRKVNFKGNEGDHSILDKSDGSTPIPHIRQSSKKSNKRGQSIISICLSKNDDDLMDPALSLKSSRTLHDLGNSQLIYRLRGCGGKERACQAIEVSSIQEERREAEVYSLLRRHPHRNLLRLHTISIEPRTDRTVLLQTVDYYPRNLHRYLAELTDNNAAEIQRARERKVILFQILKALRFLHSHQITHRNLTPASVLLTDSLEVALGNFSSLDSPELSMRTPLRCEWLIRPPEVLLQPRGPFAPSGDVWEFGCLVVFMLRGRMPFQEYSAGSLIVQMSRCIGRPSAEDRLALGISEPHKFIFPNFRRESLGKSFRCADTGLVDILRRVFVFNPAKRATAAELMQAKYFDELREHEGSRLGLALLEGEAV